MKLAIIIAATVTLLALAVAVAAPAFAEKHTPKITLEVARQTALARVPGKVKHEELEKEHGRWIYSFEVKPAGQKADDKSIQEVNVDADTGEVVSVETEKD